MELYLNRDMLVENLEIAVAAVRAAGHFLAQQRDAAKFVNNDHGRDLKLELDVRSEKIIVDILQQNSTFSILSEEQGFLQKSNDQSNYRWIVDPLDGSVNYFQGIPFCCVSVALYHYKIPLVSVVYDFVHDELYHSLADFGAWLNGEPITISDTIMRNKAILCMGFPVETDFSKEALEKFTLSIQKFKKVRLLGSAALSLSLVASGRADAYYEQNIKIWDVAAGIGLVKAAGGIVKWMETTDPHTVTVFATNAQLPIPLI